MGGKVAGTGTTTTFVLSILPNNDVTPFAATVLPDAYYAGAKVCVCRYRCGWIDGHAGRQADVRTRRYTDVCAV